MILKRIELKNWKNFKEANADFAPDVTYLVGANSSGKSNFLDALRFLRDISKPVGGGFQQAIATREGITKVRCFHARSPSAVSIKVILEDAGDNPTTWSYFIEFGVVKGGSNPPVIKKEIISKNEKVILERPNSDDLSDKDRLSASFLENINVNKEFRAISDFFAGVNYQHLVPQLLKFNSQIGGNKLENDPFGQGFLERISRTPANTRTSRINKIFKALNIILPQFSEMIFEKDEVTGLPHLQLKFKHHRPSGAKQRENDLSDGTLRLIGIFWSLLESNSLLLLEEPELSLNEEIVQAIPNIISNLIRKSKTSQIFLSTHSTSMLSNKSISPEQIIMFEPSEEGTVLRSPNANEKLLIKTGFSPAEVFLKSTKPKNLSQLTLSL